MLWFTHKSNARNDEYTSALIDVGGLELYGFYWILVEIISEQFDEKEQTFCEYSLKNWSFHCKISQRKFKKLLAILTSHELQAKFKKSKVDKILISMEKDIVTINIPKVKEIKDQWTKKKIRNNQITPERLWSNSGATPDSLRQHNITVHNNKNKKNSLLKSIIPIFNNGKDQEKAVYFQLRSRSVNEDVIKELISSNAIEFIFRKIMIYDYVTRIQKSNISNPVGYLVKSIKEDYETPSGFDEWYSKQKKDLYNSEIFPEELKSLL